MQRSNELVQESLFTLRFYQHPCCAVLHPARQVIALCKPVDKGSEADPLNNTGYVDTKTSDRR